MIERRVKPVRALERGLDVLAELRRGGAASLHDLHQRLGLPKATLLRMLVTLAGRGLVWQRLADGAYLPSLLGAAAPGPADPAARLAELASPHLAELGRRVPWPSVLAVPRADHVEVVETNSLLAGLDTAVLGPVGTKLSYIHTAVGRAYLAACPASERAAIVAWLKPADASAASIAGLDAMLAETVARGWSSREPALPWADRSRSEVVRDGRRSIGMAIHAGGRAVAALNVTWPQRRIGTDEVVARHLATLRNAAEAIGRAVNEADSRFGNAGAGSMRTDGQRTAD